MEQFALKPSLYFGPGALEALEAQGSELILAYSAAGGDLVQAGWTAR